MAEREEIPVGCAKLSKRSKNNNENVENMIPIAEPSLGEEELKNVIEAVKSSWISSKGKFIEEFEQKFANYCGRKYGVTTSNGTVALHLALEALGIKRGEEIIVPDLTFVAVANVVTYCNAKPIFVDSHPDYWCIDPEKIEDKITEKTKAIIPVHLYGHPCDMDTIMKIAKKYNLYVIEDAAEAHGAEYKGKKVGSFGDISCFSFYGNKIITTGEGGMCLTNNEELTEKMRILRDHGMNPNRKYWHDLIGFNYRITNLQAAVGVAQLKKLDRFVEKKREIARWHSEGLKELEEEGLITLHPEMPWAKCVYWMYSILIDDDFGVSRDELMKRLEKNRIEARPFFYPMHVIPPYKNNESFPVAEGIARKGINLPSGVGLMKENVEEVANVIITELR
jgi:perosamine synthetase